MLPQCLGLVVGRRGVGGLGENPPDPPNKQYLVPRPADRNANHAFVDAAKPLAGAILRDEPDCLTRDAPRVIVAPPHPRQLGSPLAAASQPALWFPICTNPRLLGGKVGALRLPAGRQKTDTGTHELLGVVK